MNAIAVVILVCAGILGLMLLAVPWAKRPRNELPPPVVAKLKAIPQTRPKYSQHRVDLVLASGRVIQSIWIAHGRYPSISPSRMLWPPRRFRSKDVVDVQAKN